MHMQEGIGRDGYRVIAGVFFGFGLIGLGTTLYAFRPSAGLFDWLGFGFSSAAFLVMFTLILVVLQRPPGPSRLPRMTPGAAPSPELAAPDLAAPVPPKAPQPSVDAAKPVNFEFADPTPAPGAAPTNLVLPPAFQGGKGTGPEVVVPAQKTFPSAPAPSAKDPRAWPERRGGNNVRKELTQRYTANAPVVREIITSATNGATQTQVEAPTVLARALPSAETTVPPGMVKGRCGGCDTVLAAPKKRPLNLRCPRCDKITLLK